MRASAKLIAALIAVYLFGIATPYLAHYAISVAVQSGAGNQEFSRKTSPDGVLDAVVIQDNPGAFSSYLYYLYLVPKGSKVSASSDPAIVSTSEGDALSANWDKAHFLSVNTGNSHVKFFGNLWYSKRVPDYYVELTLTETRRHYLQENGMLRGQH